MARLNNIESLSSLETLKAEILTADKNLLRTKILNLLKFIKKYVETYYNEKVTYYRQLQNTKEYQELTYALCSQLVNDLNEINVMNSNTFNVDIDMITPVIGHQEVKQATTNLLLYNADNYIDFLNEQQRDFIKNNDSYISLLSRNLLIYEQYYETHKNKGKNINDYKNSNIKEIRIQIQDKVKQSYDYFFIDTRYNQQGLDEQLKCAALFIIEDITNHLSTVSSSKTEKYKLTYDKKNESFNINNQIFRLSENEKDVLKKIGGFEEGDLLQIDLADYKRKINRKSQQQFHINVLQHISKGKYGLENHIIT